MSGGAFRALPHRSLHRSCTTTPVPQCSVDIHWSRTRFTYVCIFNASAHTTSTASPIVGQPPRFALAGEINIVAFESTATSRRSMPTDKPHKRVDLGVSGASTCYPSSALAEKLITRISTRQRHADRTPLLNHYTLCVLGVDVVKVSD